MCQCLCLQSPEECEDSSTWAMPALDGSTLPGSPPHLPLEPAMEDVCRTSSDNSMEGLRWRQGHKPHPGHPTVMPAPHRGTPDTSDDGLMRAEGVLNALRAPNLSVLQDSQKPPLPDAGGPQSMQSMSQLLDKLAKENQEIRLMQAELQVGAQCHVSVLAGGTNSMALRGPPTSRRGESMASPTRRIPKPPVNTSQAKPVGRCLTDTPSIVPMRCPGSGSTGHHRTVLG
uniref:PBX homeobox interacting protein 1 n=1 Tax=Cyanistes caeruleus TaxID=156563 RepID=A0A8C0Z9N3_CYACU